MQNEERLQSEEQIWADDVLPLLQAKAMKLAELISAKERFLKKAPVGRLRISKRGDHEQWFHVSDNTPQCGKYIPMENQRLARNLAQKDYDRKILPELKKMLSLLDGFIKNFQRGDLNEKFGKMHSGRRKLITPVCLPNDEFVKNWQSIPYAGKEFEEDAPEIITARGERVRSKSEAIIADTLYRLSIPYKYECPRQLNDFRMKSGKRTFMIFPDFTCLNVRLRREFVWEHFGMMDNADYSAQVAWKIACYEANGYFLGRNVIASLESNEVPLDAKKVERIARYFLL